RQRGEHQGEAEAEILDRGVPEPGPEDRTGVVADHLAAGEDPVGDELTGEHDRVERPEDPAGDQAGTQHEQVQPERAEDTERGGDGVAHRLRTFSTLRTASYPSTAQTGTTRKKSSSSTGSRPGSTSPTVCAGS